MTKNGSHRLCPGLSVYVCMCVCVCVWSCSMQRCLFFLGWIHSGSISLCRARESGIALEAAPCRTTLAWPSWIKWGKVEKSGMTKK